MSFLTAAATALIVGVSACWVLLQHAARLRLVDHPVGRKDHQHPTPVIGGIAVFLAIACGWTVLDAAQMAQSALGFCVGGLVLVVVGAADDVRDLSWRTRMVAQCASALVLCLFGSTLLSLSLPSADMPLALGMFAVPFTVFSVMGLINAVNMIDGVDGLSGSIVTATLLVMAILAQWSGDPDLGSHLLVAAAAVLAFLGFNFRFPGRVKALTFLGNSGSALLGLMLAWAAIELTQGPESRVTPSVAPWLVALPILDCLTLIGRRLAGGRSPFSADRMHFHHLLLDRGFSASKVVIAGLLLHLAIAGIGLGLLVLGATDLMLILGFLVVLGIYALVVVVALAGGAVVSGAQADPDPLA